eukprot:TRINITY_DN62792_c0_g1_i1.p1 TRINITY_DN62792_c0_g1~~TRINITY_DN62792_c0_g1_i1.p1  ORF type:complete len:534 (-),score=113.68 TRINITY_DN62792_c0_g1_i1:69-1670(-)
MEHFDFDVTQVDVIVADDEDICRLAAASALRRFGFLASRVYEAQDADEAVEQVLTLQDAAMDAAEEAGMGNRDAVMETPVMVFLPQRFCSMFRQCQLLEEPFLVCASTSARVASGAEPMGSELMFHCSVPKTFDASKLATVFEICQRWWKNGGGAPGGRALLAALQEITKEQGFQKQIPPAAVQETPETNDVQVASTSAASNSVSSATSFGGGNNLDLLSRLLPARTPFEDIEMIALVGRGSFGRVYRARWDVATVALKVVEHYGQGKPAVMAFEGALSATLAHPNLVQTFKYSIRDTSQAEENDGRGMGVSDAQLMGCEVWIVQEWCSLGTLHQKLAKDYIVENGGYDEVLEVCAEIAAAANYLHGRGIIHGDLTSSNVLVVESSSSKGYTTKVADFGLARVLDNGESQIATATIGTVTSMPPELFQLEGYSLTQKVDVYAFGVITWELCTNKTPFEGYQPMQVVVMVSQGASLKLPDGAPDELKAIFTGCVARNPNDRPDFERLVQDLTKLYSVDLFKDPTNPARASQFES